MGRSSSGKHSLPERPAPLPTHCSVTNARHPPSPVCLLCVLLSPHALWVPRNPVPRGHRESCMQRGGEGPWGSMLRVLLGSCMGSVTEPDFADQTPVQRQNCSKFQGVGRRELNPERALPGAGPCLLEKHEAGGSSAVMGTAPWQQARRRRVSRRRGLSGRRGQELIKGGADRALRYCVACLKVARRVDLTRFHHKKIVTARGRAWTALEIVLRYTRYGIPVSCT